MLVSLGGLSTSLEGLIVQLDSLSNQDIEQLHLTPAAIDCMLKILERIQDILSDGKVDKTEIDTLKKCIETIEKVSQTEIPAIKDLKSDLKEYEKILDQLEKIAPGLMMQKTPIDSIKTGMNDDLLGNVNAIHPTSAVSDSPNGLAVDVESASPISDHILAQRVSQIQTTDPKKLSDNINKLQGKLSDIQRVSRSNHVDESQSVDRGPKDASIVNRRSATQETKWAAPEPLKKASDTPVDGKKETRKLENKRNDIVTHGIEVVMGFMCHVMTDALNQTAGSALNTLEEMVGRLDSHL